MCSRCAGGWVLHMGVRILKFSVLVGHGFAHHAAARWKSDHVLRYH